EILKVLFDLRAQQAAPISIEPARHLRLCPRALCSSASDGWSVHIVRGPSLASVEVRRLQLDRTVELRARTAREGGLPNEACCRNRLHVRAPHPQMRDRGVASQVTRLFEPLHSLVGPPCLIRGLPERERPREVNGILRAGKWSRARERDDARDSCQDR